MEAGDKERERMLGPGELTPGSHQGLEHKRLCRSQQGLGIWDKHSDVHGDGRTQAARPICSLD